MLCVGITGNIGSGKSTVCRVFETLGVPIYVADLAVKQLYANNTDLKTAVLLLLGNESYLETGEFNVAWVKQLVFANPPIRERLNAIVHPFVFRDFEQWCGNRAKEGHTYAIKEAAILFESGADSTVDLVIGVLAAGSVKISRVMSRDGVNKAEAMLKMNAQWPQERWMNRCDFLVTNNGESSVIEQVLSIHHKILKWDKKES